jgi:hypothetical protein
MILTYAMIQSLYSFERDKCSLLRRETCLYRCKYYLLTHKSIVQHSRECIEAFDLSVEEYIGACRITYTTLRQVRYILRQVGADRNKEAQESQHINELHG